VREDVLARLEVEHRSLTTRALVDRLKAAAVILAQDSPES
jgi:hypothetical protein